MTRRYPLLEAVRSARALFYSTREAVAADFPEVVPLMAANDHHAMISVPLVSGGEVLGALGLSFAETRAFPAEDQQFARALADLCAQAVHRARLFAAAQAEVQRRAAVETELRVSRDQLDAILGGVADGVAVQDAGNRFIYANEAAARMAGFESVEAYLEAPVTAISERLAVLDAEGRAFSYDLLPARRALRGEPVAEMLVQFRRRDTGEVRWSLTRSRAIRGPDGAPLAISIFHDVTEQILAERRLRFLAEAAARLPESLDEAQTMAALTQVAAETLADWAVVYEVQDDGSLGRTVVAHRDPARAPLVGELVERYPPRLVPGTPLWRTLYEGTPQLVASFADDALRQVTHDARHAEILAAIDLGSMLFVPLAARGRVRGALGLFGSRSGRALAAADLAVAEEIARRAALALDNARLYGEAQAAIRARDVFLSIASHELRTPVAAIKGVVQLLARRRRRGILESGDLDRWLRQIADNSDRLATLIEDLLDVGRLRAGRYELRLEDVDLVSLARQQVEEFAERGDGHHTFVFRSEGTCVLRADRTRVEQVLANLLQNAVKYAPRGGIVEVTVRCDADGATVTVRDEGIGLPADALESVFTPFGRATNAAERGIPGMGLGLYVCREIVERHGGRIWAESAGEDQGSAFSFCLPHPRS